MLHSEESIHTSGTARACLEQHTFKSTANDKTASHTKNAVIGQVKFSKVKNHVEPYNRIASKNMVDMVSVVKIFLRSDPEEENRNETKMSRENNEVVELERDATSKKLKKIRGGNRAVVTKFEKEACAIMGNDGNNITWDLIAKLDSITIAL
eukprot:gene17269-18995_t